MRNSKDSGTTEIETSRRGFFGQAAAAAVSASLLAYIRPADARPAARGAGPIQGANNRIGIGFIGCGMQFQSLARGFISRREAKGDLEIAAVCDVWEPRLKAAQERTKALKAFRNYKELLLQRGIDGVVIAVPDHLHYPIARDALQAGKDVYLEKPMTYTIEEAARLNDLVARTGRVLQVGGSGPATRLYWKVNEYLRAGRMGKILWGLISYNRNTDTGMWDYPIPGIGDESWPDAAVRPGENLDWTAWLGPARKRPFSSERYFRWRKYWEYSGGNATDLLYHRLGAMCTMIGFDFPSRVVAAGGIYVQKNREVPDTYMTLVEYPGDYTVNMISCMANAESAPVTVYGNWGTLQIVTGITQAGDAKGDQSRPQAKRQVPRERAVIKAERTFLAKFKEANEGKDEVVIEGEQGDSLGDNWLACMRSREKPVYNELRGYQVMTAIKLGVDSYRLGKVLGFDPARGRALTRLPARKVHPPPGA